MRIRPASFTVAILIVLSSPAWAGSEIQEAKATVVESPFDKGRDEFQIGVGAFSSVSPTTLKRPGFTDVDLALRFGKMLNTPEGDGILRGNCEFLIEAYGAAIVEGPGNVYAGLSLMLRYNFVQPEARLVPYFQIQAGGVYDDVYHSEPQRVFGAAFEFDLGAGLGMRYLFNPRCAAFLEFDYRHVSNADTASRNLGLNALGGLLGASFFF